MKFLILLVFFASSIGNFDQVLGHVSLTFPPARKYDLDFLDNTRFLVLILTGFFKTGSGLLVPKDDFLISLAAR